MSGRDKERIRLDRIQRARAAALLEEMADNGDLESYAFEIIYLQDSLLQATDSALLEAAGLVCVLCKKGIPVKRMTVEDRYFWHHTGKEWANNDDCEASPIHERRALKGNG